MDEYTRLLTRLGEYLTMPDVEMTDDVISGYDLYRIVDDKLQQLRAIEFDSTFKDDINRDSIITRKIGRIFKRSAQIQGHKCNHERAEHDGKTGKITLSFDSPNSRFDEFLEINKDIDSDEIYFGSYKSNREFVEKYYDRLMDIFSTLEEFQKLYQNSIGLNGGSKSLVFSDSFLDMTFKYDTYGRIDIDLKISADEDRENMYHREWYKRKTLASFVTENRDEILKRIPINVSELDYTCQNIVKDYQTSKQHQLTKKNN